MKKIKSLILILIMTVLAVCVSFGAANHVYAAEEPGGEVQTTPTDETEPAPDNSLAGLAIEYIDYLKARYGEDYEYYYNIIIETWGSVEGYLLSLGEKLPEEGKNSWDTFVGWLGEYAVIWAPPLAVILLVLAYIVGKRHFDKKLENIVSTLTNPITKELNRQSKAQIATIRSQKALMNANPKFADNVKELDEAEKELQADE